MNSNNEEPWITMNDFVEINDTGNNVAEKKEPEKKEPEKKEPEKKRKTQIDYDKAVEEFFKAKKLYDDAYERTKKKYLKNSKLTIDQKKAKIKERFLHFLMIQTYRFITKKLLNQLGLKHYLFSPQIYVELSPRKGYPSILCKRLIQRGDF